MKRALFCLAILLEVLLPQSFAAPRLKIEPPVKKITIDQSATLKLQLEWPQSEDPYEINPLEPKLENLTIENQHQSQETGETVSLTLLYEFRPVKPGAAVIYPFEISYRKTETDPWIPLFVPEQNIEVVASLPFRSTLIWLGIAIGLLGAIFATFKLWEVAQLRTASQNVPPPDPRQRVYAKAEESITVFTSPDPKEKLIHWADQLRTVIATYYGLPPQTTSTQILSILKTKGLPTGEWNEISRLFEQLTEMQFSRQDIPAHDLERMQKTLLQYVKGKIIIG
jgi:hypothetical protein